MRTNYLRHLANMLWGGGGGLEGGNSQLNELTPKKCSNFEVADKHDAVLEVIDGQAIP